MTACTICAAPCPGTADDDAPYCAWCFDAHVARAELRPPAWLTRDGWRGRRDGAVEDGDGREAHG